MIHSKGFPRVCRVNAAMLTRRQIPDAGNHAGPGTALLLAPGGCGVVRHSFTAGGIKRSSLAAPSVGIDYRYTVVRTQKW